MQNYFTYNTRTILYCSINKKVIILELDLKIFFLNKLKEFSFQVIRTKFPNI